MEELGAQLAQLPVGRNFEHKVEVKQADGGYSGVIAFAEALRPGLGAGHICLYYDIPEHERQKAQRLGVAATSKLAVGVHTDEPTYAQVEALAEAHRWNLRGSLMTDYYVDAEGNYGKVSAIPKAIADDRPDFSRLISDATRDVRSEMTPGDFELAGVALALLQQRVQAMTAPPVADEP